LGGVPCNVDSKLYDSVVWPVINYSAPLWGARTYSCINAVHNRAQRFFLGVGKYTPNDGISGDMGWIPPQVRQWKSVTLYWSRLSYMNSTRVNKRIALWVASKSNRLCKNWVFAIKQFLDVNNLNMYSSILQPMSSSFVDEVIDIVKNKYISEWYDRINSNTGPSRRGGNKLRLYKCVKSEYVTEQYCKLIMPPRHRSAFCKFRCGVAPIRIETGRYEGLPIQERNCPFCNNVEDEYHVLFHCPVYCDIRETLFKRASETNVLFLTLNDVDKFNYLFSNSNIIRACARTCYLMLQRRVFLICK